MNWNAKKESSVMRHSAAPLKQTLWLRRVAALLIAAVTCQGESTELFSQAVRPVDVQVLDGEGARNSITNSTATPPSVYVQNKDDGPLAGAQVVFTLPPAGSSAVFANGATMATVVTNSQGIAVAPSLRPNDIAGPFSISVQILYDGQLLSRLTINQININPRPTPTNRVPERTNPPPTPTNPTPDKTIPPERPSEARVPPTYPTPPFVYKGEGHGKKIALIILAVIGAGAGGYYAYKYQQKHPTTASGTPIIRITPGIPTVTPSQ
jgi:hypothetical protein